ncbi:tetratricopeptide repeat protein [Ulvibacter litoralis]|uniref:Tetratricopeptide repeat-containing protein n=1 Tax=Ulvibacter litoralis TaxID=227084 RepID=A0A1G7IIF9_9FLAO|nr:tetratricopeptide repeat protein [Ulvibacter litoralis]GHC60831.1 hypothetical protein GCM10008083_27330 [Ulvibacter litoralis]SDF12079.1 Tetratricopeptide repeat-containing protein [Ulvibacter litoralis]
MWVFTKQLYKIYSTFYILLLSLLLSSCNYSHNNITNKSSLENVGSSNNTVRLPSTNKLSEADSLNKIAVKHWINGDYQKSLKFINVAYSKVENENDSKVLAKILNTHGLIQWRLGNNEDAMNSYIQARKIAKKTNFYRLLGLTHTNQSLILKEQKEYESAFSHNNLAIKIFKLHHEYRDLAIALNNQGQIFKNQKINDSAKSYYLEALKNYSKVDYKDGEAATYYNLSDIYHREGKRKLALKAIEQSLSISRMIDRKLLIRDSYKKLSEIYDTFTLKDSALKYYKLYEKEHSNILLTQQSKVLAEYQAKMGSKVKNLQIENLKKEQKLANNKYWFIAFTSLFTLLFFSFFVYQHFKKLRDNKKTLLTQLNNSKKILNIKEQELKTYILDLSKKNEIIDLLQREMYALIPEKDTEKEVSHLLEQKILTDEDWNKFKIKFKNIYPWFFSRIQQHTIALTEGEIRFLVLLHLQLKSKEMAKTLGVSPQSVRVSKMRLKKKLRNNGYENVESFLKRIINP